MGALLTDLASRPNDSTEAREPLPYPLPFDIIARTSFWPWLWVRGDNVMAIIGMSMSCSHRSMLCVVFKNS